MTDKLKKDFYNRNVLTVAKELLGKYFVLNSKKNKQKLIGKIVEVEAYDGSIDEAAHTFNGITDRNKVMFNEGGFLYVYFTYGKHFCSNVVAGKKNEGTGILIRAMEPIKGTKIFAKRRFNKEEISERDKINLLNGPAKICQAYNITKEQNGANLCEDSIYLLNNDQIDKKDIIETTRVGIKKSVDLPWRFYIKNNMYVSKL